MQRIEHAFLPAIKWCLLAFSLSMIFVSGWLLIRGSYASDQWDLQISGSQGTVSTHRGGMIAILIVPANMPDRSLIAHHSYVPQQFEEFGPKSMHRFWGLNFYSGTTKSSGKLIMMALSSSLWFSLTTVMLAAAITAFIRTRRKHANLTGFEIQPDEVRVSEVAGTASN